MYRFSVAWTRLLPNGTISVVNQLGIDYYNNLINELVANGSEAMIRLFHWDTPSSFKDDWTTEEIIQHFGTFARLCYAEFGDRIKSWITINEPYVYAMCGYERGTFAPGNTSGKGVLWYRCVQNLLKAHAVAYHIYKDEFKGDQNGRVGLSCDCWWYAPLDPASKSDVDAVERAIQFRVSFMYLTIISCMNR